MKEIAESDIWRWKFQTPNRSFAEAVGYYLTWQGHIAAMEIIFVEHDGFPPPVHYVKASCSRQELVEAMEHCALEILDLENGLREAGLIE